MRRRGPLLVSMLVIVANAVALAGVMLNRTGEPTSLVEMTERELRLPVRSAESTRIWLELKWSAAGTDSPWGSPPWFDAAKLESIGFDFSLPPDHPDASIRYSKALPRDTYAALEYEGDAWEQWKRSQREKLEELSGQVESGEATPRELTGSRERFEKNLRTKSRLFLIDVGNDPELLRARFPDPHRFVILPAAVRLSFSANSNEISGKVQRILIREIHVPRDLAASLRDLQEVAEGDRFPGSYSWFTSDDEHEPRYAATLTIGRRHEPWIERIERLEPADRREPGEN